MTDSVAETTLTATGADVLRRKGKSFYWAGQLLTAEQLESAADLYRICRSIDDLADEASTPAQAMAADRQLGEFHQALMSRPTLADENPNLYQQAELLLGEHPLALSALGDLVATVRRDLDLVRVADQAELLRYCYGVAGTVGVMMTCLLNAREREKALPHAIDLGIAMQLTNISRDVLEDAHLNRLYLPADGAGGTITPEDIVAGNRDARHQAWLGVRNLLGMSEAYYRSGWHGLGYLPFRARLAIAVAAKVYRQIGRQILQRGEQRYWQSRCVVGSAEKLKVSVAAVVQLTAGAISRQSIRHDHELHQGLITSLKLRQPEKR
ncbi:MULTISPECIES: phytoene/squalene synthase family protein [unclassified Marinobacter]|uniref:phytoene/squalene synthase family protein n=1 Tax=unclassified Marinobacter TaxID=83889 RepID=UPI00200D88C3|nr:MULTISPECIES: phytoene/squalene synthase family protein [unclassified Marinobacter]UQG54759.1 phytoene/squalene synthase family protein [Marinobacter sp. M4C]UQG63561.1 phytoene/squalene synthase family protein [Marinobacter sp. M2C]UQG67843.1 phytoene/squalene synthase family protein [Marinobacter sp. M1C]